MSRSKKGSKGSGYDYWGRRGIKDKDTTKGSERTRTRKEIKKIIETHKDVLKKLKD